MTNYLLEVMEAVSLSVGVGSNQQLADANSTTLDTQMEQMEYNSWTKKVQAAAGSVAYWAKQVASDPTNQSYGAHLTAAQTGFQNTETEEQTFTQQADSATQSEQNQTGQDSSNIQQKVQLESAINQVAQTLSSALAQHY